MGLTDEHIWVKLDCYNPDLNRILKAELPGPCKFDRENRRWLFPQHWDTCTKTREIANKFGADILVAPQLKEWALKEKERQDAIPNVQSMELIDLPNVRQK